MRKYMRGDWVDVGRHQALLWIADATAVALNPDALGLHELLGSDRCIVVRGNLTDARKYPGMGPKVKLLQAPPLIGAQYTCLWVPNKPLRYDLLVPAWHLLKCWDVVAPLYSYDTLALAFGSGEDQALTAKVLPDLRIPFYNTNLLFLRDTPATQDLVGEWERQQGPGLNEHLAFLRAVYIVKPMLLPMTRTWVDPRAHDTEPW
jgi:hypothetical protein